jgi:hypothetical protein
MKIAYYGHFSDAEKAQIVIYLLKKKLAGESLPEVKRVINAKTTQMLKKINVSPADYVKAMGDNCDVEEVEL